MSKQAAISQQRAPIYEALQRFRDMRVVPFDVPGHKRGRGNPELTAFLGKQCVGVDVNSMITDPVALDQYLADYVTWLCPVSVVAAAANIAAWHNGPRTGGIIGSLGREVHVIDEHMAEILPQVWCLSYPGGPGLLLQGSR